MTSVHEDVNFFKHQSGTKQQRPPKSAISRLKIAALWYAEHGFAAFPLVPGTKTPATANGVYDATTDLAQVRAWWAENPRYNIGINCGASGLLVADADTYKANAADGSIDLPSTTVIVNTAHHGTHYWYRMPAGKQYGNSRGSLPKWLDIRGFGGYVVAPPSVLVEDGNELPYTYAPGHKPTDIEIANLPADIADVLEAAQGARDAVPVNFTDGSVPEPDLSQWGLSDAILNLIHNGAPKGERSEADYRVLLALANAGATDDEIRAVFVHYAIGAKYDERGDKYLARSIGKARTWLADHPPDPPAAAEELALMRGWVRSAECITQLRDSGACRVAELIALLDAIVEIAQERRTRRIVTSVRDIADRCGMSKSSAQRRLAKLADAGLLTTLSDPYGTLIDLSATLVLSGTVSTSVESVPLRSTLEDDFFALHRCDDAFTNYPYNYAIKRREMPTVLMRSLGASGLLLWNTLADGGTVKELAEVTGLTVAAVRATLKRFNQAGLVVVWEGYAKVYELHPNAEERLDERREHMVTAGIGQLRAGRNASDKASYAQRRLQGRGKLEPRERAKLEIWRNQADTRAEASYESLTRMGINPYTRVAHRAVMRTTVQDDLSAFDLEELAMRDPDKPIEMLRPQTLRFDAAEEWRSWGRDLWEVWQLLGDGDPQDKIRLLTIAEVGEDASEVEYQAARREISEQVDIALSLAPRRVRLERPYMHPDVEEDAAVMPIMRPVLFEEAA